MPIIFYLAVMLMAGVFTAKVLSYLKLPNVTGYLVAGLLIGPSVLHIVPESIADQMGLITQVTVAFIAFIIGNEMNVNTLKKIGPKAFIIGFSQALSAGFIVFLSMITLFKQPIPFSLVLSSIAVSTAPTATLMVIKQYKAKGPLVKLLLPVVAIDNATGLILFGVSVAIARILLDQSGNTHLMLSILRPIWEIVGSILLGFVMGIILVLINQKIKNENELLTLSIAFVLLASGLAIITQLSPLLLSMAMGSSFSSLSQQRDRMLLKIESFTPPIYIAFYTLAGINLHLSVVASVGFVGIGYIFMRVLGKIAGVELGSRISKLPRCMSKYLRFALIPQAGIAIGLAMLASTVIPEYGTEIRTIILGATVIYEIFGPFITKLCLFKAGEIEPNDLKCCD